MNPTQSFINNLVNPTVIAGRLYAEFRRIIDNDIVGKYTMTYFIDDDGDYIDVLVELRVADYTIEGDPTLRNNTRVRYREMQSDIDNKVIEELERLLEASGVSEDNYHVGLEGNIYLIYLKIGVEEVLEQFKNG